MNQLQRAILAALRHPKAAAAVHVAALCYLQRNTPEDRIILEDAVREFEKLSDSEAKIV